MKNTEKAWMNLYLQIRFILFVLTPMDFFMWKQDYSFFYVKNLIIQVISPSSEITVVFYFPLFGNHGDVTQTELIQET